MTRSSRSPRAPGVPGPATSAGARRLLLTTLGLLAATAGPSLQGLEAQSPAPGVVVVTGATLLDGNGGEPMSNATVVVEDGRIVSVTEAEVEIPPDAQVIDATGKWLVPGFVDTHAHVSLGPVMLDMSTGVPAMKLEPDPEVPVRTLRTLLAYGVTSTRDPGGDPVQLVALRTAVETGAIVGPRLSVAGRVIDTTPFEGLVERVATAEEVRAAVRSHAEAGVDMVKLYVTLPPELLRAGIEEAHAQGVVAVAHLMETTWTEAANMGLDHVVHIVPGSARLLPEADREAYLALTRRGTQFMAGWFDFVDLDSPEITEMIAALARNGVSVDPTLVIFEGMVRGDDPWYTENPALALAAPSLVDNWRSWFNFNIGWTEDDFAAARRAWPKFLELTRRLHEAGVPITAGTDANNPWIVPGHSFHRELELLSEAGIPNIEVLTIATRNGATVSGLADRTGTIVPGKSADMVLLSADPLAEISNTRTIEWTMIAGRVFRPDDLLGPIGIGRLSDEHGAPARSR